MTNPKTIKRFHAKFTKAGKDECWLWTGAIMTKGYGAFIFDGKQEGAHRVAWILKNGPIPDGLHVLHKCDVKNCVNTNHLFLGTNADNMRDKESKGRGNHATGDRNGMRKRNNLTSPVT